MQALVSVFTNMVTSSPIHTHIYIHLYTLTYTYTCTYTYTQALVSVFTNMVTSSPAAAARLVHAGLLPGLVRTHAAWPCHRSLNAQVYYIWLQHVECRCGCMCVYTCRQRPRCGTGR